jgi:hypothetical protein
MHVAQLIAAQQSAFSESIVQRQAVIGLLYRRTYPVDDPVLALYRYEYINQNCGILRKYKPSLNAK